MKTPLLELNARGIFPGPSESEEEFFQRSYPQVPTSAQALLITARLFDAAPDWVEVKFGSKGLMPWEGAATWIDSKLGISTIQVRPKLWGYPQEEVIAHELVHAMRQKLNATQFEEILAFATTKNRFRRTFGPLFSRPWETTLFVLTIAAGWIGSIFDLYWILLLPLIFLAGMLLRLFSSRRQLNACLQNLKRSVRDPDKALAVALRLTDQEIAHFARIDSKQIRDYAHREKVHHLRWQQIAAAYF